MESQLINGFGQPDLAFRALEFAVGLFFAFSGYHKLTNKQRHANLVATLTEDKVPLVKINQWWVPSVEFFFGSSLAAGLFPVVAATFLFAICAVACGVDGYKRVNDFKPIDKADRIDDWLYIPEFLYAVILIAIIIGAK